MRAPTVEARLIYAGTTVFTYAVYIIGVMKTAPDGSTR